MKIEADKRKIKEIADDMRFLHDIGGGIQTVINKYARILAYQYELNKVTFEIYKEIHTALNQEKNDRERKDT